MKFEQFQQKDQRRLQQKPQKQWALRWKEIPPLPPDATMIPGADSLLAMFPDV